MRMRSRTNPPFISLRKATFRLGDRLVFPNTGWSFARNQHWAVLGPNGAGKSLFADALRGGLPLVSGELTYHFRPPPGLMAEQAIGHVAFEDRRSEIKGEVAQSRWNSIEEAGSLRVRDALSYERVMEINPYEVSSDDRPARARFARRQGRAIRLLQIAPFQSRTLLSLSNGERQRVQVAHALCHPLKLLILDDPFAGLDAASRRHLLRILDQLMATSLRLLLITQRIEDLPRAITHVLRVDHWRVIHAGSRAEILGATTKANRNESRLLPGTLSSRSSFPTTPRGQDRPARQSEIDSRPLVELRRVTVRYGSATILRNINWTIYRGESWALLGPNGAGKSTLLSLILGDNPQAYRNHVEVFGRRRGTGESIWELKQQMGWVSPELHLHFNQSLTCFEVVASGFHETIGLFEAPTTSQRKAARHWLARFRMLGFAQAPLYELSLGQQRMVLVARALVKRPKLVILDEPCQGLDAGHRKMFIAALDGLLRKGSLTAIYVTHRPDEIPRSIKRVLRLSSPKSASRSKPASTGEGPA